MIPSILEGSRIRHVNNVSPGAPLCRQQPQHGPIATAGARPRTSRLIFSLAFCATASHADRAGLSSLGARYLAPPAIQAGRGFSLEARQPALHALTPQTGDARSSALLGKAGQVPACCPVRERQRRLAAAQNVLKPRADYAATFRHIGRTADARP
jgi:hypothetical protein